MSKILLIATALVVLFSGAALAATINADSANRADVATAITAASTGDTVVVPAGTSSDWTTTLTITKEITIQGAGAGSTIFQSKGLSSSSYIIVFQPALPTTSNLFRITGVTFDCNSESRGLSLTNQSATAAKARIDHNSFINPKGVSYQVMQVNGSVWGVADNNTFCDSGTPGGCIIQNYGANATSWNGLTFAFGSENNFYIEDNTFNLTDTAVAGGAGGRYGLRYNQFNYYGTTNESPWFDSHGNMGGAATNYAMMGIEVYGNKWDELGTHGMSTCTQTRGGKAIEFFNKITSGTATPDITIMEEFGDEMNPTTHLCASGILACASDGQTQHVSDTYIWSNYGNGTLTVTRIPDNYNTCSTHLTWANSTAYSYPAGYIIDNEEAGGRCYRVKSGQSGTSRASGTNTWCNDTIGCEVVDGTVTWVYQGTPTPIAEGVDFWAQKTGTFDGTGVTGGGVGCGTLAARPATCTAGVGYWATAQSCSDLTGMVGVGPSTPISGKLYKCVSTNTWSTDGDGITYTPYTYPHPLRVETPAATSGTMTLGTGGTMTLGTGGTMTLATP